MNLSLFLSHDLSVGTSKLRSLIEVEKKSSLIEVTKKGNFDTNHFLASTERCICSEGCFL